MAVIEVETVESVNNLEAMAEWIPFGRLKFPFHLYVPAAMVDVAKRLCSDSQIPVAEIHTYHWIGDEMRFLPIYQAPAPAARSASPGTKTKPASAKASARARKGRRKPAANAGKKTSKISQTQIALPLCGSPAINAGTKQRRSSMPAAATGGRGSAFSTGFARRQASRSVVPLWMKTPSDESKSTTPTSSSTGRRYSKRSRLLRRRPTTRGRAARRERDRPQPPRAAPGSLLRHPKGNAQPSIRRRSAGTGIFGTRTFGTRTPGIGTPGTESRNLWNRNLLELEPLELEPLEQNPWNPNPWNRNPWNWNPWNPGTRACSGLRAAHAPGSGRKIVPPPMPVEQNLGREQLTR